MVQERRSNKMTPRSPGRSFTTGFSLVELMVVIAIMLLLAAMALPRLLDAQMRAYEASAVSFLKILQTNQESYRLAHGSYADNFVDLELNALGPAVPEDFFAPGESPRWAALFSQLGPFSVYAAQTPQQPPAKTPPPPDDQTFGGKQPPKKRGASGGALGAPAGGGTGGTGRGSGGPAKSGGAGTGTRRPRRGAGGGSTLGGTPGGGTGGGVPGGTTAPQTGGGSGGSLSPTPATPPKSNVVLKHNYIFTLLRPTLTTWTCTVAPVRDRGNSKFFYIDQTGVMRVELGKFASVNSPQM